MHRGRSSPERLALVLNAWPFKWTGRARDNPASRPTGPSPGPRPCLRGRAACSGHTSASACALLPKRRASAARGTNRSHTRRMRGATVTTYHPSRTVCAARDRAGPRTDALDYSRKPIVALCTRRRAQELLCAQEIPWRIEAVPAIVRILASRIVQLQLFVPKLIGLASSAGNQSLASWHPTLRLEPPPPAMKRSLFF